MDFFISHAGRDRAWAEWVAWQLVNAGYKVELDTWDWAAGDNFVTKMAAALDKADRVVALFSRSYFEPQRYTTEEWSAALVKDDQSRSRLLPLLVEECDIPRLLRPLIARTLFGLDEEDARRLLLDAARGPRRPDGKPEFPPSQQADRQQVGSQPRMPGQQPAVWNVPPRNTDFTGRDAALVSLRDRLLSGGAATVQALHGMGGVGKTQLAIEYAHCFAGNYELVWWISAEQTNLISEQLAALAVTADLTGTNTDHTAAVLAVRKHLREHPRWLLIFDNADDPEAIRPWLAAGPGHVLITSRNSAWNEVAARTEIDVFARRESTALLPDLGDVDADRLAEALGDLPLALAQAAGTLAETGLSATEYLDLLADRANEVLNENRPSSYPTSLAAAVRVSMERLADEEPAAVSVLQLCAVLAPEPIPTTWLANPEAFPDEPLAALVADRLTLGKVVGRIGPYGLARVSNGIRLHRLIQAVIRDQLSPPQKQTLRTRAEFLLAAVHPQSTDDPVTWPTWAQLLPHLIELDPATTANDGLRRLACDAALYLLRRGDTTSAMPFVHRLYQQWRERIGPDDLNTLTAANELAHAHFLLGDYQRARALVEDTLPRWQRKFGEDHAGTLRSANDLGVVLSSLGEYQRARLLHEEAWERLRRVLGEDHPDTLLSMNNLASALRDLGEYERARLLAQEAWERLRRVLGEDHPDTLMAMANVAGVLRDLGEYERARLLFEEAWERRRRVLGEDHPRTMESAANVAGVLRDLGEYERARLLFEEAWEKQRRVLGEDHPHTLLAMANVGGVLRHLGEFERSRRLLEEAWEKQRRVLGEDHPHTLRTMSVLAAVLRDVGEYERARLLFEEAWEKQRRVLGEDHPHTLISARQMGIGLLNVNRAAQARQLLGEALARQRRVLGNDHREVLRTSVYLAVALYRVGKTAHARHVAEKTMIRHGQVFGEDAHQTRWAADTLQHVLRTKPGRPKRRR